MGIGLLLVLVFLAVPIGMFVSGGLTVALITRARNRQALPSAGVAPASRESNLGHKQELPPKVIELASRHGGRITVAEVVAELGVTSQSASECLAGLVNRRVCRADSQLGATSYVFELPHAVHPSPSPVAQPLHLEVGYLLGDRYEILRSLSRGGMGAIYEARDRKLAGSLCAVKEILESALQSEQGDYLQERFREEMEALANLDHPRIPRVRDFLEIGGSFYIVMDLVKGVSLEEELEKCSPLDPNKAVNDILHLLEVVRYLHAQNPPVLHRDIKPANLMRDGATGELKLVDFGLARRADKLATQTSVGTLGYAAAEQITGRAEIRSDLFSVGCSLSHLVSGKRPEWILLEPLHQELPADCLGLDAIIAKATQPSMSDRYANAEEMIEALELWQQGRKSAGALTTRMSSLECP